MNTNEKSDKGEMKQSEDARRDDKIESMKPGHAEHKDDGSCGCGSGAVKEDKEAERES